ncbi:MAG: menaquinone biosynthesis protein [Armatimonadetes bacterium]|nr:menaquinone biosynthesis protein [Armatimonadota bacterium]
MSIVIGSVPYLNGRPLMRWFTDTPQGRASGVSVVEAVPSRLAQMLEKREIAAALVSSVELFRAPGLTYAPGCAVIADGAVESVRVFSKVPVADIRRVALDTSSLTSVALTKIILRERYGLSPEYVSCPPDLQAMLADADAALLIGDLGYRDYGTAYVTLDLGAEWKTLTGLPFVYACWIGYPANLTPELIALLQTAKEWGTQNLLAIADAEHTALDETQARARHYLTDIMRYTMGYREEAALALFGAKSGITETS